MEKSHGKYLLPEGVTMAGKNILSISYRHCDVKYMESVLDLLLNRTEYAIWYDDNLSAGERFDDEIKSFIKRSVAVVQIVTRAYFAENSYTSQEEVPYIKENGLKTVAICMEDDPDLLKVLEESEPSFSCCFWDEKSVESFLLELNKYNNPLSMEEKIRFYQKKINCDHITPNEMFLLADAFADGYPVEINKDEAIRYARMASLCDIEGAGELLDRLEAAE